MSLLARMVIMRSAKIDKLEDSRYKSVIVTAEAEIGNTTKTEVWSSFGIMGMPPDDTIGVCVSTGGNTDIIVASKQTFEPPELEKGDSVLYSTDAMGSQIKGNIISRANGDLELNGDDKFFVTHDELKTALDTLAATLTSHVHPSNGTPSPGLVGLSIDISSAKTTTIKTGG